MEGHKTSAVITLWPHWIDLLSSDRIRSLKKTMWGGHSSPNTSHEHQAQDWACLLKMPPKLLGGIGALKVDFTLKGAHFENIT